MPVKEQARVPSESSSQYVNFDEFIDYQLKKARLGIHHADLLSGSILFGVGALAYLLIFAIVDQWIVPGGLSTTTRLVLAGIAAVSAVVWILWKIVWPSFQKVNSLYAAREIERAHPEFQSSLMSWVDFRQEGREIPAAILTSLEKRTAHQISQTSVDAAIDRQSLMRASYLLLALLVAFCLYTMFSPKRMSTTLWRALMPLSAVSASTRTEILDVKPGNAEVLARDQLDVTVELGGKIPEEVTLLFSTADRRFVNEPLKMRRTDENLPNFQTRLTGDGGKGLLSDVRYHIVAGDATSRTYDVRVNQPPTATLTSIRYDYPQYTKLPSATQEGHSIDAWEGTWVTVTAKPNMRVRQAILYCTDQETTQEAAEAYPMQIQDDRLTAHWQLKFRDDGTFARYFHIQVWNERDQKDPQPTIYRIKIRPDLKPEVTLRHPDKDMRVPINTTLPVAISARDPDFLLRRVALKLDISGHEAPQEPLDPVFAAPPELASVDRVVPLDLSRLNLKVGDQVVLFAEAEDNFEPFGKRQRNISRSARVTLTIVDPAPPEQKKQIEAEQAAELQEKLQQDNGERRENMEPPEQQPRKERPGREERPQQQQPADGQQGQKPMQPADPQKEVQNNPQNGGSSGDQKENPAQNGQKSPQENRQQQQQQGRAGQGGKQDGAPGSQPNKGQNDKPDSDMSGNEKQDQQNGPGMNTPGQKNEQNGNQNTANNEGQKAQESGTPQQRQEKSGNGESSPMQDQSSGKERGPRKEKVDEDQALQRLLEWNREQEKKNQSSDSPVQGDRKDSPMSPQSADEKQGTDKKQETGNGKENGSPDEKKNDNPAGSGQMKQDQPQPDQMKPEQMKPEAGAEKRPDTSGENQNQPKGDNSEPMQRDGDPKPAQGQGMPSDQNKPQEQPGNAPQESSSGDNKSSQMKSPQNEATPDKSGSQPQGQEGKGEQNKSQPNQGQGDDTAQRERKPEQMSPSGNQSGEKEPGEMKSSPGQQDQQQTGKKGIPQPADGKPGEQRPGESKNANDPQSDDKNGEMKPAEQNPPAGGNSQPENSQSPMDGMPGQNQTGKNQPGQNQPGQNQPGQNQPGQNQPGQNQPGQNQPGQNQPGQHQPGQHQPGQIQPGQNQPGQNQPGQNQPGQNQPGQNQPGQDSSGQSPPGEMGGISQGKGENHRDPGQSSGTGNASGAEPADPADLAHRKKATELALKRLKQQLERGETPESLMNDLGYSQEDLEQFMKRLDEQLADPGTDRSPESEAARRQFESLLKGLSPSQERQMRSGGDRERKASQSSGSGNRPVPPQYRPNADAYKQKLNK